MVNCQKSHVLYLLLLRISRYSFSGHLARAKHVSVRLVLCVQKRFRLSPYGCSRCSNSSYSEHFFSGTKNDPLLQCRLKIIRTYIQRCSHRNSLANTRTDRLTLASTMRTDNLRRVGDRYHVLHGKSLSFHGRGRQAEVTAGDSQRFPQATRLLEAEMIDKNVHAITTYSESKSRDEATTPSIKQRRRCCYRAPT